jgi:HD-GYP domain-containing protein (c-di-GMP phosphodiesterase class II)
MNTSNLSVGMFVGMLDRPWLETPFIFQGFEIKEKSEIKELQKYCSQVYVEIERGKLAEKTIRALAANGGQVNHIVGANERGPAGPSWLHRFIFRMGLGGLLAGRKSKKRHGEYEITSTVRREAPEARAAYDKCAKAYRRIVDRTQRVGNIKIDQVVRAVTPMIQSILRNPDAMAWTVFSGKRTDRNYSRAVATAVWAVMFGRHLGFSRKGLQDLAVGGLLLDIGNVELSEELLSTAGAFTHDEYDQVPHHVQAGVDILQRSKDIEPEIFEMVMYHHERYDGSGYPYEINGSTLPPLGRIAGIVDCYDAMTTKTSYSPALAAYDAARELNEMRDQQFHAEVVEQFLHTIGMFPTGSVVELSNGSCGLVLEQNRNNPLQPKVLLLRDAKGKELRKPRVLNAKDWQGRGLWIAKGHEHGAFGIDPMDYFN